MAVTWKVDHLVHDGVLITDQGYIAPHDLTFTRAIGETGTINYGVSLADDRYIAHDWVSPFDHDWRLTIDDGDIYDDYILMDGVLTTHEIDVETHLSLVAGEDYGGLFDRAIFPFDPTFPDPYPYTRKWGDSPVDVADVIIRSLITTILAQDNRISGVTLNIPVVDIAQFWEVEYGDSSTLNDLIDNFAKGYPGFDYAWRANKNFWIWAQEFDPTHTPVYSFVEDPTSGDMVGVSGLKWTNTGPGATHILGQGSGVGTRLAQNYEYAPSSEQYRRLDIAPDFGDLPGLPQIRSASAGALGVALAPIYEISMNVDPDQIITPNGFYRDFVPGAYVFMYKDLIAHKLDGVYKIIQMQHSVSRNGKDTVALGMNRETNLSLVFDNDTP